MKNIIKAENLSAIFGVKQNNGGEFTVVSKKTGKSFTFKIANKSFKGITYCHVSVVTEYLNWRYLGVFFNGKIYHKKQLVSTLSADSIAWIITRVKNSDFELLDNSVEVMHLGNCIRCGKTLTDVDSIERGLGPECAKSLGHSVTTKKVAKKVAEPKVANVVANVVAEPKVANVVAEQNVYSIYAKFTNEYRLAMNQSRLEFEHHLSWSDAVQLKDEYNLYRLNDCTEYYYIDKSE